jgi:predicted RNA-binding protein with PUA-like domain
LPLRELRLEEGERLAIFALDPSAEESLSQYRDPESGALPERWSVRLDGGIELELRLAASDRSEAEPDSSNAEPDSAAAARLLRSQPLDDATWRQLQALQGRYQMRAAEKGNAEED